VTTRRLPVTQHIYTATWNVCWASSYSAAPAPKIASG